MKGFPKLEVNWTRDGKLTDTTNKLIIKQVTYEDAGQYTCSTKNSEGKNEASFYFSLLVTLFIFCSFFLIEVKGGSHSYQREGVLVHNWNKYSIFFFIAFFFFFSLLRSNFHNFFHCCKNEKKGDSHFPNQIYGLLKHIKKKAYLESKNYF